MRIQLLGGFSVSVGERAVGRDAWRLRKAAGLVKVLALEPGRRIHRERAMDLLWPDLDARAQANNLRQTLHAARKALDPAGGGSRYLRLSGEQLALCPDGPLWTDVAAFEEAAASASRSREPAAYRAAVALYAGDLLPGDLYEAWAEGRREALRGVYLTLLDRLAALHEERGEHESAVEAAARAVAAEPLREEAHVRLMRLHALRGRPAEALGQYERLSEALSKGLGAEPNAAARDLRDEILAGRFPPTGPLPAEAGPPRGPAGGQEVRHNLPAPRTSFVGREKELAEARRALALTRLLTLTGPGGAGKTRLALALAGELAGSYPDGVWLVELAPLSEETLVPQAVARALGVRERPGHPVFDALVGDLKAKEMLLLLDNCEHLVDAAARLVDALLDSCPGLRVLATSREPLGVAGELSRPVPALSLPEADLPSSVEGVYGCESARLFVERAIYRNPAFTLTKENAGPVARICRRLDGIPLAIELAAARVGSLSAAQICARLDDSLGLLSGGGRTATPRQRTIRGALDWSHDLLDGPERRLFARLSIFTGGFELEAAEAVGEDIGDVLDLLGALVSRSLVAVGEGDGEEARYRLLEPVRQYAREKLEEGGEEEVARERHAEYYLALAERAEGGSSPPDPGWLDRLQAEHDNLRAALRWLLERGDAERALRLSGALGEFWRVRGHLREGLDLLEATLAREGGAPCSRVKALNHAGWICWEMVDFERSRAFCEEALALSRALGDKRGAAVALYHLGMIAIYHHMRAEEAWALFEESLALQRELGEDVGVGRTLQKIGLISVVRGDFAHAQELYEESLRVARATDDGVGVSLALWLGALAALGRGEHRRVEELSEKGLSAARRVGYAHAVALLLNVLAASAGARGRALRSARLWGAAEALLDTAGYGFGPAELHHYAPYTKAARAILDDDEAWEAALAEGRAMTTRDEAVEYALASEEPEGEPAATEPEDAPDAPPAERLTRREREVADLVARGLTNRQVSAALTISRRTTDNHVANILKKLNLDSRAGIAARLRETVQQGSS